MKKECDANGLEYELLMQESAKERFLREINSSNADFNKHLVVLKQKRQSESTNVPTVGAPAPSESEPVVAAPKSETEIEDPNIGNPPRPAIASVNGAAAISGIQFPRVLVMLRERFGNIQPLVLPASRTNVAPAIRFSFPSLPTVSSLPALSSLPSFSSLPTLGALPPIASLPPLPTFGSIEGKNLFSS